MDLSKNVTFHSLSKRSPLIDGAGTKNLLIVTLSCSLLAACSRLPDVKDTSDMSVDDVGTVRTAVISVAPWHSYADALQPKFNLSIKEALEKSIATTRRSNLQQLNETRVSLGVGLDKTAKSSITKTIVDEEGKVATTTESTTNKSSGELPETSEAGTGENQLTSTKEEGNIEIDSRLHRHAASALYQEIQVLDRYIKDAVTKQNYTPYLVRLQFNLMPRQHGLPLDAYVNLSFFSGKEVKEGVVIVPLISTSNHESSLSSAVLQEIQDLKFKIQSFSNAAVGLDVGNLSEKIDSTLARDINNTFIIGRINDNTIRVKIGALQQLSSRYSMVPRTEYASVMMLVPDDKTSIQVTSFSEIVNTLTGQSLAYKSPSRENNDIEYLLEGYFGIDVAKVFPGEYGVAQDSDEFKDSQKYINNLWELMLQNDYKGFKEKLNNVVCIDKNDKPKNYDERFNVIVREQKYNDELCKGTKYLQTEALWAELAYLQPTYVSDFLGFELPTDKEPKIFPKQTAIVLDDGKSKSTVTLYNGKLLRQNQVCASWVVNVKDKKCKNCQPLNISASSIQINSNGDTGTLIFPSLKKLGYTKDQLENVAVRSAVSKKGRNDCWTEYLNNKKYNGVPSENTDTRMSYLAEYYLIAEEKPAVPKIGHQMIPSSEFVALKDKGKGSLRLLVVPEKDSKDESLQILVSGGIVTKVTSTSKAIKPAQTGNQIVLKLLKKKLPFSIEFYLTNLAEGEDVIISTQNGKKAKAKEIKLRSRLSIKTVAKTK